MNSAPAVDLAHMPLVVDGRPRKRWRDVGVFGSRLLLCGGVLQMGPALQTLLAVGEGGGGTARGCGARARTSGSRPGASTSRTGACRCS